MTVDFSRLGRLIRKELSETLRDRRTIVTLVLMPVLLYPLLSIAFQQFFLASRLTPGQSVQYQLGFVADEDVRGFFARLQFGDRILERRIATNDAKEKWPAEPKYVVADYESLEAEMRAGRLDAIVRKSASKAEAKTPQSAASFGPALDFEVLYLPTSPGAQGVLAYIDQRLAAANERDLIVALKATGKRLPGFVVRIARMPLEEPGGGTIISLASLVPLILILMTITGAVYPAIDLTAGERERGTLEILVAAPVPRLGLLFAKYVSVVAVAVLTALVNLVAMTLTLMLSGLGPLLFGDKGLSPGTVIQVFGLLLLFAAFFSAVLLCITSFARSFKEAQAYLIPLMLASMGPGVMGMMPGLKLADWAWAPLFNIVLLGRDLFEGGAEFGPAFLVIISTLTYALAAIALAARIFGAESVLYSEQSSWGDLLRRPAQSEAYPHVSTALWCLALMIPLSFVLKGVVILFVQAKRLDESAQIFAGPPIALAMFVLLPAVFAWRGRLQMSSAFAMSAPPWTAWFAGIVLGFSVWPLLFAALSLLNIQTSDAHKQLYEQILESYRQLSPTMKVALVAIPAALEEWFFRGYVYGALRKKAGPAATIAITAFLFGLMHFVLNMQVGLVRVLPSTVMGVVLGHMRESSGSVWPGMVLHVIHNSCLVLLIEDGADQPASVEPWWIGAGAAGCTIGAGLTWLGRVRQPWRRK